MQAAPVDEKLRGDRISSEDASAMHKHTLTEALYCFTYDEREREIMKNTRRCMYRGFLLFGEF